MAITRTGSGKKKKPVNTGIKTVVKTTPSGCNMLDLAMGGGAGWGKVLNIIGDKSSGKTLLVAELLAAAKYILGDKLRWFWDDAERGFSFNAKAIWGFDMLPDDPDEYSETIEEWMYNVNKKLKEHIEKDHYFIYIMDSLDAITSDDELQRGEDRDKAIEAGRKEKGSYKMEKAKLLSEFFRTLKGKIQHSNCLLIIISQVRSNINAGLFGKKYSRTGGKALDFYAMHCIELTEVDKIKESHKGIERKTGVTVKAFIAKNKLWKPYRECFFKILFDYGIDNVDSDLCFLFDLITDHGKTKKAINVTWDGEKFKSRKELIKYIEKNNQENLIKKLAKEKWNNIEAALAPTDRKKKYDF